MFEEVRETGLAGPLVLGADMVPDIDRDDGGLVVFVDDEGKAVFENEFLLWDVERAGGTGGVGWRGGGAGDRRPGQKRGDQEVFNRICRRG